MKFKEDDITATEKHHAGHDPSRITASVEEVNTGDPRRAVKFRGRSGRGCWLPEPTRCRLRCPRPRRRNANVEITKSVLGKCYV